MKTKFLFLFLLILFLPLGGLVWFGQRMMKEQQTTLIKQAKDRLSERLSGIDQILQSKMEQIAQTLSQRITDLRSGKSLTQSSAQTGNATSEADDIRELIEKEPLIKHILLINASKQIVFPPSSEERSQKEEAFLVQIRPIIPDLGKPAAFTENTFADQKSSVPTASPLLGISGTSGSYIWFGMNLLFWQKTTTGEVIVVELDRSYFLSEISEVCSKINQPEHGSIFLIDELGRRFYQRGRYLPDSKHSAQVSLVLSYPLQSWKLEYHEKGDLLPSDLKNKTFLNTILSLSAVGLSFLAIALYFYREQNRLIQEAKKRVSFVNQVSHELKTPLTNICMYAELLENELVETEEKAKHHVEIIVSESQRLSRLINNILRFARKQKNITLHPKPGNLNSTIQQVLQDFAPAFSKKRIEAFFELGSIPEIPYDPDAIEQILANLLSNVEKYASTALPENSKSAVFLKTKTDKNWVIVEVQDQGPGIPSDLQEKIFEPFYRISDSVTEGVSGTGIGLTLARDLARMHGGDLKVISSQTGACFELTLPISA